MSKGIRFKKNSENAFVDRYYRVGDLYLTTRSENPSTIFGGIWELFGPGRTLVCVDTSQNEFNTVKKTGGSKYLQEHTHNMTHGDFFTTKDGLYGGASNTAGGGAGVYTLGVRDVTTGNSGNLQPFITCYIWIRTA